MNKAVSALGAHESGSAEANSQFGEIVGEWRHSWRPGLLAWVGGALGYSAWSAVSSVFVLPLQAAFGWSRGDIAYAANAGLISSFAAPLLGRLVDRLGVRPVLLTGLALTAVCYALFSMMTGSLPLYYALYLAFILCGTATTGITFTRIIIGAFEKTRGTALAICRSGMAVSGAVLPTIIYFAIMNWGYAGGYLTLAALLFCVALPLAWAWAPAKDAAQGPRHRIAAQAPPEHWAALIRRPKVLILCLAGALNYAPVVAILTQTMPLGIAKGLSPAAGVGAISVIGFAALAGALLSGVLVDRFWAPLIAFMINATSAVGCLFLLPDQVHPAIFYVAAVMIGLSQGAEIDIVAYMISRYFGLRSYATIYGLTVLTIGIAAALAGSAIGQLYDHFGNYNVALGICSASFAIAACCYLLMGRYPKVAPE